MSRARRSARLSRVVLFGLAMAVVIQERERSDAGDVGGETDVIVVVGAAGADEYRPAFEQWAERWRSVAEQAGATHLRIGEPDAKAEDDSGPADREQLSETIPRLATRDVGDPLWIVLIGHGTFHRETAKFNLIGPDVSAEELAAWLEPARRPLVVVNNASASGPFINRLSGPQRVIVTATKSGTESNYARFGDHFSDAIGSGEADLDHDGEVSVLEAFLHATAAVREFYRSESRLNTEHALIDDNGDELGTPASLYRGLRVDGKAKGGSEPDGGLARRITLAPAESAPAFTAAERDERDEIERAVESLRSRKASIGSDQYYGQLEPLMIRLATLYRDAERRGSADDPPPDDASADDPAPDDAPDDATAEVSPPEDAPDEADAAEGEPEEPAAEESIDVTSTGNRVKLTNVPTTSDAATSRPKVAVGTN